MTGAQFGTFILGLIVAGIVVAIGVWLLHWLYLRSSKERAIVRTLRPSFFWAVNFIGEVDPQFGLAGQLGFLGSVAAAAAGPVWREVAWVTGQNL